VNLVGERQRRQPFQIDGEDQRGGGRDHEFRHGDDADGEDGDDPVVEGAAQHRRGDAERQSDRHREERGDAGELQRVDEAPGDEVGDRHFIGIGRAEIALQQPDRPAQETKERRLVEMHGRAEAGDGFRRGRLAKQDRRRVARQASLWRRTRRRRRSPA
jgi:hypothetical protein